MSRRRSRGTPRCRECRRPVVFFRSVVTRSWRPFEQRPVDPAGVHPTPPWVIENNTWAWPYRDLVEDLRMRLECGRDEAEEHANAMPWHLPHDCPNRRQEPSL